MTARFSRFSSSRTLPGQSYSVNKRSVSLDERDRRLVVVLGVLRQEAIGEHWNLVASLAQRRQRDADDVQSKEQILAELSLADRHLQVAVGRRENTHIDVDVLTAAEARELPVLQHLQQLRLQRDDASR